jgi:hypothetical protein
MALPSRRQNNLGHPGNILHHIQIGETHHAKPQSRQAIIPSIIPSIIGKRIMRIAVNFHRESDRRTEEIHDRFRFQHHMLPPKLEAAKLAIGERTPQPLLGFCGVSPHFVRSFQQLSFGHAGLPHPNPSPEGEGLRSVAMTCVLLVPTVSQSLFLIQLMTIACETC